MEAVIKWANMTTNYFARHIGLARGENLYQIKRGNNGISMALADRIVTKFPQIDRMWLLTGEGRMFTEVTIRGVEIPFYDVDLEEQITNLATLESKSSIVAPIAGDCDIAMRYMGRAMGSVTPVGTIVLLRQTDPEAIIPGEEYVIIARKLVTLRTVRTSPDSTALRLVAADSEHYDEMTVERADITSIYKVKAKLIVNA